MKNIKELIYAAVEENAVVFQELAGNILQARAYDAIEALRPEVGASMFGESSHMKGKDDEDEEMEGDEDEDEEDDKKKSMKEALVGKQHEIDVDGNKKINAKDFAKLRAMKKNDIDEEVGPSSSRFHVLVHKASPGNVEKAHYATSSAGNKQFRPGHSGMARMDKPGGQHDPTGGDHHVIHAPDHVTHSELKKNLSGYGARATIVDTHTGNRETVHEGFDQIDEEAKATVDALKKVHGDHNFHVDKKGEIKHAYLNNSHVKKLVTALNTPGKGKGMIDRMMEEVEQVNERTREETISQIKGLKKPAIKHGFDWPTNDSTDNVSTGDLKRFHKSARSVIKQGLKKDVQEVAMPKNAADWQAMINHQIQIAGHPVATDAQFRATTVGKDMSKIASLEPGEDMLQYATAQGGTVKK
jgi:uncharacterized protein YihD (DUF1040 family)